MANSTLLFGLAPMNELALEVVALNPRFLALDENGAEFLAVTTGQRPDRSGELLTVGLHANNDIRLPMFAGQRPSDPIPPAGLGGGHSYQRYRTRHLCFFLAPSGELILRDLSHGRAGIEVGESTAKDVELFNFHGSEPRQRVIPRIARDIYINFGVGTTFLFQWHPSMLEAASGDAQAQQQVRREAKRLEIPGMFLTKPSSAQQPRLPERRVYDLRTRFTPSFVPEVPYKHCYHYRRLGSGAFGDVWKGVDMATGELWAVKELKVMRDQWKETFKKEVDNIGRLRHANIVHFETYQDFRLGGSFQLFFRLYSGSLATLLPRSGGLPGVPLWAPRLVTQTLKGLQYLHANGMIHRDIKPGNILFDQADGSGEYCFYIADFGLSTMVSKARGEIAGTEFYMAPEVALGTAASDLILDVWSFAITLGCVLGFWSERDRELDGAGWEARRHALGCQVPAGAEEAIVDNRSIQRRWCNRVASLAHEEGVLPSMFSSMLAPAPHRVSVAKCLKAPPAEFLDRPRLFSRVSGAVGHGDAGSTVHIGAHSSNDMSFDIPRITY